MSDFDEAAVKNIGNSSAVEEVVFGELCHDRLILEPLQTGIRVGVGKTQLDFTHQFFELVEIFVKKKQWKMFGKQQESRLRRLK